MAWPPKFSEICENAINLPAELDAFLYTLLTSNSEIPTEYPHRHRCLVGNSFEQDIIYGMTGGKPSKQMLIPYAVKTLQTAMLNLYTALCLQKMAVASDDDVPLPKNIQATLAWDNIDRIEETLYGTGTSHRVNVIAVEARHFGAGTSFRPLELSKLGQGKEDMKLMMSMLDGSCINPFKGERQDLVVYRPATSQLLR